jgi:hypothetical protein
MPLRDHFRQPLDHIASWEELHSGWPMVIVQQLRQELPEGYVAGPHVHSGSQIEPDIVASKPVMICGSRERSGFLLAFTYTS